MGDPQKALDDYANAMSLGNTKTLPELFEAADLKLGFDEGHFLSLLGMVESEISELAA